MKQKKNLIPLGSIWATSQGSWLPQTYIDYKLEKTLVLLNHEGYSFFMLHYLEANMPIIPTMFWLCKLCVVDTFSV